MEKQEIIDNIENIIQKYGEFGTYDLENQKPILYYEYNMKYWIETFNSKDVEVLAYKNDEITHVFNTQYKDMDYQMLQNILILALFWAEKNNNQPKVLDIITENMQRLELAKEIKANLALVNQETFDIINKNYNLSYGQGNNNEKLTILSEDYVELKTFENEKLLNAYKLGFEDLTLKGLEQIAKLLKIQPKTQIAHQN